LTTLIPEDVQCSVCGATCSCMFVMSTNTMGPPDLDLRPAEMARSNMPYWVHRCPACGYCAADLASRQRGAKAMVRKKEYIDQLNHPDYPELANSFLCKAMLDDKADEPALATWALIHAAWVCDDHDMPAEASECRRKAADKLEVLEPYGLSLADEKGAEVAILVDLLRRSGQMARARDVIMLRRGGTCDENVRAVLDFQLKLVENDDTACHNVGEAFPAGE